jgi:hypothetical protein
LHASEPRGELALGVSFFIARGPIMSDDIAPALDEKAAAAKRVQALVRTGAKAAARRTRQQPTRIKPDQRIAAASRYNVAIPLRHGGALAYSSFPLVQKEDARGVH